MPRPGTTHERGYGHAYRLVRASILGPAGGGNLPTDPPCAIRGPRCTGVATTAEHDPPIHEVGHPHLNLVPACRACNCGWKRTKRSTPSAPPSRSW